MRRTRPSSRGIDTRDTRVRDGQAVAPPGEDRNRRRRPRPPPRAGRRAVDSVCSRLFNLSNT
ncbi:hypothetical protein HBB16_15680 [Pseudonocardia sp. MCCB 268]|nr:hypothetical protein [Pseudonocardia cytotoxica]